METNNRIFLFDVLRGVAILMVMFFHDPVSASPENTGCLRILATVLHQVGWTGVDLFFVLSGFLLGSILLNELKNTSAINIPNFLLRRCWRIWPSYYTFLLIAILFNSLIMITIGSSYANSYFMNFAPSTLFFQNFLWHFRGFFVGGHTWSLCVEEHFYLLLPFLLLFVFRLSRNKDLGILPGAIAFMCIISLVSRSVHLIYCGAPDASHVEDDKFYLNTFNRWDSPLAGIFLAYLKHYKTDLWLKAANYRKTLALIGILLVVPFCIIHHYNGGIEFAFTFSIGFLCCT